MTEQELKEYLDLQKQVMERVKKLSVIIEEKNAEGLDKLNKDLVITEINALSTLLGILVMRIGLNITKVQEEVKKANESKEEETTATPTEQQE